MAAGAVAWLSIGASSNSSEATAPRAPAVNQRQEAPGAILLCPGARRGLEYWKRGYAQHRAVQRLSGPPKTVRYDCEATIRRASEWKVRAEIERYAARAWIKYNYDWSSWLPSNWQALGACETGYGRRPGNFGHQNSRFVSAFGISRREYDADARHMGAAPWNDARPPTPRDQYLAALGHYDRFGDGWSCPGP